MQAITQSISDGLGAESAEGNGEKPGARRLRRLYQGTGGLSTGACSTRGVR
jgi:hypothetical protein